MRNEGLKFLGIMVLVVLVWASGAVAGEYEQTVLAEFVDDAPVCAANYGNQMPANLNLPATFDWRNAVLPANHPLHNLNGGDFITPAQNQNSPQRCGSCWIFAPMNSLEARFAMAYAWNDPWLDLAEQEVLSCNPDNGDCTMNNVKDNHVITYDYLFDHGVTYESCFPYEGDVTVPCADRCDNPVEPPHRIQCYKEVTGWPWANGEPVVDDNLIKKEVYLNGPVVTAVHNGGHFEAIIGWDDNTGQWILQNSGNDPSWELIDYGFERVGWETVGLYPEPDVDHLHYCDGCHIDLQCYEDGELNPSNHCEVCDVSESRIEWSFNERPCTDGSKCTYDDLCQNGVCVGKVRDCDDGQFCTGVETCDDVLGCQEGEFPCPDGYLCDEENDECDKTICAGEDVAKQLLVYLSVLMGGVVLLKRKKS